MQLIEQQSGYVYTEWVVNVSVVCLCDPVADWELLSVAAQHHKEYGKPWKKIKI